MSFDETIKRGTQDKTIEIMLRDSSTGQGKTGIAYTDVTAYYIKEGLTATSITMASSAVGTGHTDGGWGEVDSTNMPGLYQFDIPDAALSGIVNAVTIQFKVSGVIDKVVRIGLIAADWRDATVLGTTGLSTFDHSTDDVTLAYTEESRIQNLCEEALTTYNLDHLMYNTASDSSHVANNSALAQLFAKSGTWTDYNKSTSSLEALGDDGVKLTSTGQAGVRTAVGLASANLDTVLGDIPTTAEFEARTILASAYFDPATDTVANVTTVGSVTNAVTTDAASRTASQADVSSLATAASISALNDFDPATDTVANVTTVGSVTNAVTTDSASRTASQADVSSLATSADLATVDGLVDAIKLVTDKLDDTLVLDGSVYQFTVNALENAPSSSGGDSKEDIYTYFTTSSRQDTFKATGFSTFDSSTDTVVASNMRGTDNANTIAPDNNSIAAILVDTGTDIPALIGALHDFDPSTESVIASNMRGTDNANTIAPDNSSIAAILIDTGNDIPNLIAGLNDFNPTTQSVTVGTNNDKTGYALSEASRQAIGDDFLGHTISKGDAGTIERAFWQSLKASQLTDGEVEGTPTASAFDTNLTAVSGAYDHLLVVFTSGSLAGEARPIDTYVSTNGRITLLEPLTSSPSSSDEFIVVPSHVHPVSEIAEGVWSEDQSGYTTDGTFGYYLDLQVSAAGGGSAPTAAQIADAVWDEERAGHTTEDTFGYYLDSQVSEAGASGTGLYQVTVTVQNEESEVLQGARVNVDGTVMTLSTDSSGQCVFNLDSGIYTLHVSPPAGYQTPTGNVITITTSDISSTFTLSPTPPSGDCDVPWVG